MEQTQKRVAVRWEDTISRQFLPARENHEAQVWEIENSLPASPCSAGG
jgi:hypothetical protein